jgi:hypothetical protein
MDRSPSHEPDGIHDPPTVDASAATTNRTDQGAIATTRTRSSDPIIAALQASLVYCDLTTSNAPAATRNTIQAHYGAIPVAQPTVPAVERKSHHL